MPSLPQYGNIFPDDILARLRDLESATNSLQAGTFAAVVTLAGDVTGDSTATVVGQLQGYPISSTAPSSSQVLTWNGSAWAPATPSTSVTLSGDVTGASSANTVGKLQGRTVSSTAPSSNQVLRWNGSAWAPATIAAGGDVVQSDANVLTNSPLTYTSLRGTTQAPTWRMERSSGTSGSPTALAGGLTIGGFTFGGYGGSTPGWVGATAGLFAKTTQTYSGTAQGTYVSLETTENGTASRLEALRITDRGDLLNVRGFPSLRPDGRFAYQQRGTNMLLARTPTELVTELYVSDSTGHVGASDAEQTSCISIYEAHMARRFNNLDRTVGFMPVQHVSASGYDGGIQWDTVQGTATNRGPGYQARLLTSTQYCEVTRRGSAVTVYYTAQQTGGGTATVTINGSTAGTINTTDGTLAAGTYDSGRSVTYLQTKNGPIKLKVECTAGTQIIIEGAYFHNGNNSTGYRLIRADKSGQSFSGINANPNPLLQSVANIQPDIVTLQLGINDTTVLSGYELTADELAAAFETLVGNIRAQYATWTPSIRYFFANQSSWVPDDWSTNYRTAMRDACLKNDVLFIDGHDAVGSVDGSDPYDFSDDTYPLHPNDYGHWVWGEKVAAATITGMNLPQVPLLISTDYKQPVTASLGVFEAYNAAGVSFRLTRDEGAAVANGVFLGSLNFRGVSDAYGTSRFGSAVSGVSESAFSGSSWSSGLRFWTTNTTTSAIRAGFTAAGDFFVGSTFGSGTFTVANSTGNTSISGDLSVGGHPTLEGVTSTGATGTGKLVFDTGPTFGAITVSSIAGPVLTLDNAYNTVTGSLGGFGLTSFGSGPNLNLRRAQGTAGSPTNITSGILLSAVSFSGYNSDGSYYIGAQVRGFSEEAFSTAAYRGSRLEFLTAPTASGTAAVVRALINQAGTFYVGATAAGAKTSIDQNGNVSFGGTLAVTGNATLSGTLSVTGHPTLEGVTATGATGTGALVFGTSPALTTPDIGAATATSITASAAQSGAVASITQGTVGNPVMQLISTATNDDPTETIRQYRLTTSGVTTQTLGSISLSASTTTAVQAVVIARRTGGKEGTAQDGAGYIVSAVFQGTVQIGTTQQTIIGENQAGWDATLDYNTNAARVRVTGATNNDITWHATVRIWTVGT